ncbi:NUDIX hydrolase [Sorangium cellulosum]|uniref:NUDIX hydrolase n=1 Tax=Sorangium cellulosum TaxID=56 RepID=A0A150S353_SORCE|nr:NUDIX hydrolase [Sorangium cellulosum]KYF91931.1 NUDIX hydrolase [Sorangium cellulosum]
MSRTPIPTWCFAVVLVRLQQRFLLVHERKHGQLWYLPAGRVEPGETFAEAARREALEETGVPVELEGILRVEHSPSRYESRFRVIFLARPADGTPPKRQPDEHSLEARWVTLKELRALPLRGPDAESYCADVLAGAQVFPLSLLGAEGEPLLVSGR